MTPLRLRHIFTSSGLTIGMGMATHKFCESPKVPVASSNPADCENPACHSTLEMFKLAKKRKKFIKAAKESNNPYQDGCPATKGQLGDSSWQLIHTVAANYPDNPSPEEKKYTYMFFESLAMVYPCPHCAKDFQDSFARKPADVSSRQALVLWCCQLHNEVNEKLGLPIFPCTMDELDLRWKYGRDSCFSSDEKKEQSSSKRQ